MTTVPIEEADTHLRELLRRLGPGEELLITEHGQPVAQLKKVERPARPPRKAGNCEGMLVIVADDDEHLQDFAEYME